MSLTYHPFENIPALEEIRETLHKNISDKERTFSAVSGLFLIGASRAPDSGLVKTLLIGAGVALLGRAFTGHCPLYEELDVRRALHKNGGPARAHKPGHGEAAG